MKKIFVIAFALLQFCFAAQAQTALVAYEAEILLTTGTGKRDTREVNAVIIFEKETVKIKSRRGAEIFREFKYSEISAVQHNFARAPKFKVSGRALAITLLTGFPAFLFSRKKERNWVTILGDENFAVLKAENDNYRQLLAEFAVRKVKVVSQDEDTEKELN